MVIHPSILSSLSIILIFIQFSFNSITPQIKEKLNEKTPKKNETIARKRFKKKLLIFTITKPFLLVGSHLVLFYILLPTTINIYKTHVFEIWDFSLLPTFVVMIEAAILIMVLINGFNCLKLIKKLIFE